MRQTVTIAAVVCGAVVALGWTAARAQDPLTDDTSWMVRTSRMQGAASDIQIAAASFQNTSRAMTEEGRLQGVALLFGKAQELDQKVTAARLAAEVLDKPR
ncbi:MAG: hypothetical protein AAFV53_04095 [Myxococcota bacterium]